MATGAQAAETVERFAPHEVSFRATGAYANPYTECAADAALTGPDGAMMTIPLFWDGGDTWKLRFAPDTVGAWRWSVKSRDAGLDGKSGTFDCVASKRRGSLQPLPADPHHFQYQNGEHVWFLGDTAWALLTDNADEQHDRAAMERYVRHRAAQGFNAVHSMVLNEAGWGNSGGLPWQDIANERLNPAYFQEAERRVAFANAQGLIVGLAIAWGDKGRKEPWAWHRLPDLAARLRHARHMAARVSAYAVYFLVSGEWHAEVRARQAAEADVRAEFVQIGDALRAADPHRRMIGIHPMTAHGSTREFNEVAAWMDFADYQQNYQDLHGRALASRAVAKPVINAEYAYYLRDQNGDGKVDKPNSSTIDDIRHATWDIAMAGAYVITGFGSTYMGGHRHPTPFLPEDPKNRIWETQIGHVKRIFESVEYWKLAPHDELLAGAVPSVAPAAVDPKKSETLARPPAATQWCLADPDHAYLVYLRGAKQPVELRVTRTRQWQVVRHDPRTGRITPVTTALNRGAVQLAPPDEQDWVFVIQE